MQADFTGVVLHIVWIITSSLIPKPCPAFRRLQYGKAVEGLGSHEWRKGREKGREDLIERKWIVDVPMHVIADSASCVLVGAHSGSFFFFQTNKSREDLSKA